jgi:hypothetical protein
MGLARIERRGKQIYHSRRTPARRGNRQSYAQCEEMLPPPASGVSVPDCDEDARHDCHHPEHQIVIVKVETNDGLEAMKDQPRRKHHLPENLHLMFLIVIRLADDAGPGGVS